MQPDPFATPIIFLRIAWMTRYQGIGSGDAPVGGGAYVAEHGFGHEIYNFQRFHSRMYGYGQPSGRKGKWAEARINLTQLGASAKDKSASGVLAIWVATSPTGGAFIVGWYNNATIFRDWQSPPAGSARSHAGTDCGYYVTAKAEDVVLLVPHERVFPVPQQKKGGFGRSNIWYANNRDQNRQFRVNALRYVDTRQLPPHSSETSAAAPSTRPALATKSREDRCRNNVEILHSAWLPR